MYEILYCLGKIHQILNLTKLGRKGYNGSHLIKATETLSESKERRRNSSATFPQDSTRCSSAVKSKLHWADWRNTRKFHMKNSLDVDVQRHFLWNERQRRMSGTRSSCIFICKVWYKTMVIHWSRFRKEVVFYERKVHKEFGTISRKRCCWNSQKSNVQFSVLRFIVQM